METQTFENEESILRTFTTNIRLAVNGSKFLRKQGPFWSRAADGVCLMLITSKHHFGFSNIRLLHEDKGQQCHKIYWQGNAKNPDICPRQFNAFRFNLLNVTSRDDYYHTKKCWLLLRQLFSWFGSNAQIYLISAERGSPQVSTKDYYLLLERMKLLKKLLLVGLDLSLLSLSRPRTTFFPLPPL